MNGVPEPRPQHEPRGFPVGQLPQELARPALDARVQVSHEVHEAPAQRPRGGVQRRHVLRPERRALRRRPLAELGRGQILEGVPGRGRSSEGRRDGLSERPLPLWSSAYRALRISVTKSARRSVAVAPGKGGSLRNAHASVAMRTSDRHGCGAPSPSPSPLTQPATVGDRSSASSILGIAAGHADARWCTFRTTEKSRATGCPPLRSARASRAQPSGDATNASRAAVAAMSLPYVVRKRQIDAHCATSGGAAGAAGRSPSRAASSSSIRRGLPTRDPPRRPRLPPSCLASGAAPGRPRPDAPAPPREEARGATWRTTTSALRRRRPATDATTPLATPASDDGGSTLRSRPRRAAHARTRRPAQDGRAPSGFHATDAADLSRPSPPLAVAAVTAVPAAVRRPPPVVVGGGSGGAVGARRAVCS